MNSTIKAKVCKVASNVVITDSYLKVDHLTIGENTFLSGVVFTEKNSVSLIWNFKQNLFNVEKIGSKISCNKYCFVFYVLITQMNF